MNGAFSITNLTRCTGLPSRALLARVKHAAVGARYRASIVFAGPVRMQALNRTYRKKSYTPNVLSFPLAKNEGEMFICPSVAAREARAARVSTRARTAYLVIHGLLHLKGLAHGATMTRSEERLCKKFNLPRPECLNRGAKNLLRN